MYKLVVVDDEKIIREGLTQTIDWEQMGFTVAGEAENGLKAMELIRRINPQVVLADIKMPVMNGLELIKQVKEYDSDIRVVLLSGHEEFAYAREGMLLGAEGYILKLSVEKDVEEVFDKISRQLDEEQKRKALWNELKAERRELIHDKFLRQAIHGEVTGEDIKNMLDKESEIPLEEGCFCAVCIQVDRSTADEDQAVSRRSELACSLLAAVKPGLCQYGECAMLQPGNKIAIIYYSEKENADRLQARVTEEWKNISYKILRKKHMDDQWSISVGIGDAGKGWQSIYTSYYHARKAAMFETDSEAVGVLTWEDVRDLTSVQLLSVKEENEFVQSVVMGDRNFVQQQMNYMFKGFDSGPISVQDVQFFIVELIMLIHWRLRELGLRDGERSESNMEINRTIYGFHKLTELAAWTREYIMELTALCYDARRVPVKQNILKVAKYLENHFHEKILLEEMANYVYMSPSYFSVLFKQYTGKSFSDYLLDIRMEKAGFLLKESYKVTDVAERVGYHDIRHFSKSFKKYYGVNPSDFK